MMPKIELKENKTYFFFCLGLGLGLGLGLVGDTDIMSFMSPRYFSTYSFQWRIPLVILRYMAHLDSSNKLFFILKKSTEKTALVTQNHHF